MDGAHGVKAARAISSVTRVKVQPVIARVANALDILEAFDYEHEDRRIAELARKLNLHKNRIFRLLATLETRGYVEQDKESGNYRLGSRTFEVGNVFLHHLGIRRQAHPMLVELVGKCNETAYLAVLDGPEVIYVSMHETTHSVRIAPKLGHRLPAYCTAAGKCQLAYESRDKLDEMLRGHPLTARTEKTISDYEDFFTHLREIGRNGYATEDEEWEWGVRSVAAPIRDYAHRVIAAVAVSGPSSRIPPERIDGELIPLAREAAARISQRLGYEGTIQALR